MENKKLEKFINELTQGLYKNCFLKIKLDSKGELVYVTKEQELLLEEKES